MSSAPDYMRNDYPRRPTTSLVWLVSVLVAAFVLQLVLLSPKLDPTGTAALKFLTLTISGLKDGHLWSLLTHALLHDTSGPQILFTLAGLIYAGRELESILGSRRFIALFAGAILLGGLAWTAVHWAIGGTQFGATPAVYAFLVVLTCIHPRQKVALLLFPVGFQLRHLVYALLAVDLLGLVFYEVHGAKVPWELNPSAHLGGMVAGLLYARFLHAPAGPDRAAKLSPPRWLQSGPSKGTNDAALPRRSPPRPPAVLRAAVDQILDKINSQGFASLSDEEKRTLDEAKDLLSKH